MIEHSLQDFRANVNGFDHARKFTSSRVADQGQEWRRGANASQAVTLTPPELGWAAAPLAPVAVVEPAG
jgi:hypothetical protein